jgi:hypothetical protein
MGAQFDDLVHSLEPAMLEELRRTVAAEVNTRREQSAVQLEHIHARMSEEDRGRALAEISRVLRGE